MFKAHPHPNPPPRSGGGDIQPGLSLPSEAGEREDIQPGFSLPSEAMERLEAYAHLLLKWNGVVHLTSVNTLERIRVSHLLDSLSVVPYVAGAQSLCDVGSGAGLPGIPLAIALPHLSVTLLESNQKKGHFLHEAVRHCGLSNVQVMVERVENYHPAHPFSIVITRAFSSLKQMLQQTAHLCDNEGRFLAMKANVLDRERQDVPDEFLLEDKITLLVPSLTHRTLWIFKKRNEG